MRGMRSFGGGGAITLCGASLDMMIITHYKVIILLVKRLLHLN